MSQVIGHESKGKLPKTLIIAVLLIVAIAIGVVVYPVLLRKYQKQPITTSNPAAIIWAGSIDSIEQLDISSFSEFDLVWLLGQAEIIKYDTALGLGSLKSFILYDKVAKELELRVANKQLKPNSEAARYLHTQLEKEQFMVDMYKPSQLDKLWGYAMDGKFEYIWRRIGAKRAITLVGLMMVGAIGIGYFVRRKKHAHHG